MALAKPRLFFSPWCSYTHAVLVAALAHLLLVTSVPKLVDSAGCVQRDLGLHYNHLQRSYSLDVQIDENVPEVIFASPTTPQSHRSFLGHVQDVFAEASRLLHVATNFHAHIGQVRFFLPRTWPRDNIDGELQCNTAKLQPAVRVFRRYPDGQPTGRCVQAFVPFCANHPCGRQSDYAMELPVETLLPQLTCAKVWPSYCPMHLLHLFLTLCSQSISLACMPRQFHALSGRVSSHTCLQFCRSLIWRHVAQLAGAPPNQYNALPRFARVRCMDVLKMLHVHVNVATVL